MKRLRFALAVLCCAVMAAIACVVVFAYGPTSFYLKEHTGGFLLGNVPLLIAAAAVFGAAAFAALRLRAPIATLGVRLPLALSAAQVLITYHAYFFSVWDARYVLEGAWAFAYGMPDMIAADYFEMYPNNLALVGLFGSLLRLPRLLGMEIGQERGLLLLVLFQCALNTACGMLTWSLTRRMAAEYAGEERACAAALLAFMGYAVLIGLSPWFLVPYSDGMALIFPALTLWIDRRAEGRLPAAALIGALGAAAYLIKPQACIPMIAIVLCELASLIVRRSRKSAAYMALLAAFFALVYVPAPGIIERELGVSFDAERAIVPAHFLNMGLNDEHDGALYTPDLDAAMELEGRAERTRRCLASAAERVRAYGVTGMAGHLLRKTLVNFSDGGFAWGVDFARNELPLKHETVSPWIRSVIYEDGARYPMLHSVEQAVWLLLLALCPLGAWGLRGARGSRTVAVAMLSALGIVAFNMLFEAKACYVYAMVPVLLALAAAGVSAFCARRRA